MEFIPVNKPLITDADIAAVSSALKEGWISGEGPYVEEFEEKFADAVGRRHGVSVSNGTAAVDLLIEALDFPKGAEIILPSFTITSCVNQILRAGLVPVFVDADPITWNMDTKLIAGLVTNKTKAIMVVHIYGMPVDIDPVIEVANQHGLLIIEDAAEAHGQTYRGKPCGSFGVASVFSFYANKNITTGEGGMVLTDDLALATKLRKLKNLAFNPADRFVNDEMGWNMRMSSMQCALGSSQLSRLEEIVQRRKSVGTMLRNVLSELPEVQLPVERSAYAENHYWVFGLVLAESFPKNSKQVRSDLEQLGIGTRPFFAPLSEQPFMLRYKSVGRGVQPVATRLFERGFYIPNGLGSSDTEISHAAEVVKSYILRHHG